MNDEVFFPENEFIISKTDSKGIITYYNEIFINISGYSADELIGHAHSILRHKDMPKVIFKKLWDDLQSGKEVFAYVKNRTKQGQYYWVLAFVTPSYDGNKRFVEYFSVRRRPDANVIKNVIEPLYRELLQQEKNGGIAASANYLENLLKQKGVNYEQFIFSL